MQWALVEVVSHGMAWIGMGVGMALQVYFRLSSGREKVEKMSWVRQRHGYAHLLRILDLKVRTRENTVAQRSTAVAIKIVCI